MDNRSPQPLRSGGFLGWRLADMMCLVIAGCCFAIFAVRQAAGRGAAFFGWMEIFALAYAAYAVTVLSPLRRRFGLATVARCVMYPFTALVAFAAVRRMPEMLRGEYAWPPRVRDLTGGMPWLTGEERARWTAIVLAHAATNADRDRSGDAPDAWPLPAGVVVRVDTTGDTLVIRARAVADQIECSVRLSDGRPVPFDSNAESVERCDRHDSMPGFRAVRRYRPDSLSVPPPSPAAAWPQYRRDAANHAAGGTSGASTGFVAHTGGEVRSSVIVSGDAVIVGTHGTGTLGSISLATGRTNWAVTLPN